MRLQIYFAISTVAFLFTNVATAQAQDTTPPTGLAAVASPPSNALPSASPLADLKLTPIAYVETYYQYNFNRPSNGISNELAFDNRHNSFTLSNVVLGGELDVDRVTARLVMQVGSTGSTYYASEPLRAGAFGANASDPDLWKYVQEANLGYLAPLGSSGHAVNIQAGLFLAPIGPEGMAVKDNWTWSRSNLFFGLPFYLTGARATYALTDTLSLTAGVFNGWNSVVDNNEEKSVEAHLTYKNASTVAQLLYFGGVERNTGAPEGPYWRHDIDAYVQTDITDWLSAMAHVNGGWEPNRFGTADWYAGQLSARVRFSDVFAFAVRGDRFYEDLASNSHGTSAPIFWNGVKWVSEGTATFEVKPVDHILFRLEYRHDQADGNLYFRSQVAGDGTTASPYVPNARSQDTLTLGATAWL